MADWTAGIPWSIAVVGWGVTHLFSEGRERRKEARGQIDKVYEALGKLARDAHSFHTAPTRDDSAAHDLVAKVRNLERQISRIGCLDNDDCAPVIIRLRRAITLRNFDLSEFKTQQADSDVLEDISTAVEGIEDEMERQYRLAYPAHFPYVRLFVRRSHSRIRPK